MDENVNHANRIKCETLISNLGQRNMNGYYCETVEEAKQKVLSLIHEGDLVSWGGSATLDELGVKAELEHTLDGVSPCPEEAMENRRKAFMSDVYLTSTNAIALSGELVNIDKTGNRVAAMCFGPKKVIVVAGINKIADNEAAAMERVRTEACIPNAIRLGLKTPCVITGRCGQCLGQSMCCHVVVTRANMQKGRMHIVLVNAPLGY